LALARFQLPQEGGKRGLEGDLAVIVEDKKAAIVRELREEDGEVLTQDFVSIE